MTGAQIHSVRLFRTSRGVFLYEDEALLKKNRAKITDRNDPNFGARELPESFVALTDGDNYFLVQKVDVIGDYHRETY